MCSKHLCQKSFELKHISHKIRVFQARRVKGGGKYNALQGYLAHKTTPRPRPLPKAYA